MNKYYIIDVLDMLDIEKIEEYNQEFLNIYTSEQWTPFVTRDNFDEFLQKVKDANNGILNDGLKEKYYWFMENDKIIGLGSIKENPEISEYYTNYVGHIFYQIVPSRRNKGLGTLLCHLLLKQMNDMGYEEAIMCCHDTNKASLKIIENNGGKFVTEVLGEGSKKRKIAVTRIYKIDIKKSLLNFNNLQN